MLNHVIHGHYVKPCHTDTMSSHVILCTRTPCKPCHIHVHHVIIHRHQVKLCQHTRTQCQAMSHTDAMSSHVIIHGRHLHDNSDIHLPASTTTPVPYSTERSLKCKHEVFVSRRNKGTRARQRNGQAISRKQWTIRTMST